MANPEALITRYRPANWGDVVGHSEILTSLIDVLERRSGHSFLLTGPSGVGKTSIARLIAASVGCENTSDIIEVDAATWTGIDDMRTLTEGLRYRPLGGESKCLIIDEAHALSRQAIQSLLKSIEEPPDWVYWILCTTEEGRIPPTIKTRCLAYNLKPVEFEPLYELVERISKAEGMDVADDIKELCAREAEGSPRQAIANLAACAGAQHIEEAAELLRSAQTSSEAIDLARALVKGSGWKVILPILQQLDEKNPESVRHTIRAYLTKAVLGTQDWKKAAWLLDLLNCFAHPWPASDGLSPVLLAVGMILSNRDQAPR